LLTFIDPGRAAAIFNLASETAHGVAATKFCRPAANRPFRFNQRFHPISHSVDGVERILVVDDEPGIVDVLTFALEEAGFATLVANDGLTALRMALTESPSLILLDVMLPGLDGLTVCREIRAVSDVPIILLTARGTEADRIVGLELHADDYVVKPFSVRELVARVRTNLRRSVSLATSTIPESSSDAGMGAGASASTSTTPSVDTLGNPMTRLRVGLLELDTETFEARWDSQLIGLSRLQFDLLALLAKRPKMVFTREYLLQAVWGTEFTEDVRTVDSMVKRLRSRLKEVNAPAELIMSKRDLGYCLDPAIAAPSI
jgi:two-component system, OmpR family, response regulator VicR